MSSSAASSGQPLPSHGMSRLSDVSKHALAYTMRRASCGEVRRFPMSHSDTKPAVRQPMSVLM